MTLKEFAIELPALRDEAKALWLPEEEYILKCSKCELTYNYWDTTFDDDMPTLKYCNQCGGQLLKIVDSIRNKHVYHLHQMLMSNDPVKYLKDHSKGEQ